jgi:hypothetical protein
MMTKLIQKNERNDSPAGNFDSKVPREPVNKRNHRLPIAASRNQKKWNHRLRRLHRFFYIAGKASNKLF